MNPSPAQARGNNRGGVECKIVEPQPTAFPTDRAVLSQGDAPSEIEEQTGNNSQCAEQEDDLSQSVTEPCVTISWTQQPPQCE